MYGVINMSVRELVLEKFGAPAWEDVLAEAGMSKDLQWVLYENYPDSVTVSIVLAAAAKLGVDADSVLELYGVYIMGSQLKEFLFNLDYLHAHLADTFQGASFPHFHVEVRLFQHQLIQRCERRTDIRVHVQDEDGSDDAGFKLHYQSTRGSLLAPFVKGLVSTIAKEIFEKDVEITAETNDRGAVFHIKVRSQPNCTIPPPPGLTRSHRRIKAAIAGAWRNARRAQKLQSGKRATRWVRGSCRRRAWTCASCSSAGRSSSSSKPT
jgi:hypothetical protein